MCQETWSGASTAALAMPVTSCGPVCREWVGRPGSPPMPPSSAAHEDTVPPTRVWPAPCRSPEKALVLQRSPSGTHGMIKGAAGECGANRDGYQSCTPGPLLSYPHLESSCTSTGQALQMAVALGQPCRGPPGEPAPALLSSGFYGMKCLVLKGADIHKPCEEKFALLH